MKHYEEFTSRYTKLGRRVNDLSRIAALLHEIGDPQTRLRFVHVAGTNGKGSVCEMTARALTAAGCKTGLFTSPYIIRYNDRIRIDGAEVSDEELDRLADIVSPAAEKLSALGFSQFEITQAMGLLHFEREKCDVVVLETGLGGLLDSTNVIPPPLVSVICSLSLDHTAILGDTIEQIAAQKAGIIKRGSPAVLSGGNPDEAVRVVKERAAECGSELYIPETPEPVSVTAFGSEFIYKGHTYNVSMGGAHQLTNACTALETLGVLRRAGFEIPAAAVAEGLRAVIPARLQILSREPLVIVDGGHNPQGVAALAAALDTLPCRKRAVIGMLGDKDSAAAAGLIAGSCERFVCVDGFAPNARPAGELAEILRENGAAAVGSELSAEETVRRELEDLPEREALVICGSLYLAALFAEDKEIKDKR
jgi:dihydrofolate synthase/folylpolyglutamate synthase